MSQLKSFTEGQFEDLLGSWSERRGTGLRHPCHAQEFHHSLSDGFRREVQPRESHGRHFLWFVEKGQKDVLGTDESVVEQAGFLLGQHQDSTGTVGESLEHWS